MRSVIGATAFALSALIVFSASASAASSESRSEPDFTINLRARSFLPVPGVDPALAGETRPTHAIVQLHHTLTQETEDALERSGVLLLDVLHGTAYVALISNAQSLRNIGMHVRWAGPLTPADKVQPALAKIISGSSKQVNVVVLFHQDVTDLAASQALRQAGVKLLVPDSGIWLASATPSQVRTLAANDLVLWIEQAQRFHPVMESVRQSVNADAAQNATIVSDTISYAGATGKGTTIAILDSGIDREHDDFWNHDQSGGRTISRVTTTPGTPVEPHGTHVAGIAAGNGFRTSAYGLPAFNRRGIAPEADLYSPDRSQSWLDYGAWFYDSYNLHGAAVSNNSYIQTCDSYGSYAGQVDRIIRGTESFHRKKMRVAPRPAVWAAGNNGESSQYCGTAGYFSVTAPAKNSIAVASLNSEPPFIRSFFSSLGPTSDGRLKPDLSAPGCHLYYMRTTGVVAYGVWSAKLGGNSYIPMCGTSMAAPVVTGAIALLHEPLVRLLGHPPLPSTYKVVLVQGALDVVHLFPESGESSFGTEPDTGAAVLFGEGPDYATGFGEIDIAQSMELVKRGGVVESHVGVGARYPAQFSLDVPQGAQKVRISLAWDDESANPLLSDKAPKLVNDLDLEAVSPDGTVHFPWVLTAPPVAAVLGDPDPIHAADIQPAQPGVDHANNVEQVEVKSPMAGKWTIRVRPYSSPVLSPQRFSLAASHDLRPWKYMPPPRYRDCGEAQWTSYDSKTIRAPAESCVIVPLPPICQLALDCGCRLGSCKSVTIRLKDNPAFSEIVVLNTQGESIAIASRSHPEVTMPALEDGASLVMMRTGKFGVTDVDIPVRFTSPR
jgi:subtilisin family serine protease